MLKKIVPLLAALLMVVPLAAGGSKEKAAVSSLERIQQSGKIILGTSADYPPYEFHYLDNGQDTIVGFDVAIARQIASDLGVELEIKDMGFDGLLAALVSGNVDFVISGMTPTEERKQNVDFSEIYYKAVHGVVIRAADADKYRNSPAELKDVLIAAQRGAIQVGIAKEQIKGVTGSDLENNHPQIKELGALPDLIMEVKNSKVEAVVAEFPVAKAYVAKNPDLIVADYVLEDDEGGSAIALKKNSPELQAAINAALEKMIAAGQIDTFVGEANLLADQL
ncbi:MAG: transporter substrate-binding domain-containing protein [Spirochaetaceae bacterium]|nr:transporter substrate-binding domain-containing protein [Spirochaetaceae bacterium]